MIPGIVISAITFPGVIVHELAHQFFCWIMKIPVYEVQYFRFENPSGYVIHERSDKPLVNFVISMGPFFFNTLLGAIILFPASIAWETPGSSSYFILTLLAYWLGISILMHAFPSTGDAQSLVATIMKNKEVSIFVKILVAPFIGLIYLAAFGSIFWLDLGYAVGVSFLLPKLAALFL